MPTAIKTPKLFIGGQFVRSESGRTYKVQDANVPLASRKDARDAVVAARKGLDKWSGTTAYNRGQIIYRLGEMLEGRSFTGVSQKDFSEAMDLAVHYAGWTDKFSALLSSVNPVAGAVHNYSRPEPVGVVVTTSGESLSSLMRSLLAPLSAGCSVIAILPEASPLAGLELAEAWATSDLPGGVVNFLSGTENDFMPALCEHIDVDSLDLSGSNDATKWTGLATKSIKRVHLFDGGDDSLTRIESFVELKTVWHSTAW